MGLNHSPRIITSNLVLCLDSRNLKSYPGSGSTWSDLSSTGLNATGSFTFIDSNGIISGGSWTTPSTSILNNDQHSIFFMLKLNSSVSYPNGHTAYWDKIFSHNVGISDRSPSVWRYPSNRLLHWRYDPSNTGIDFGPTGLVGSTNDFDLNTWYHVGVTKNAGTATAYVNGRSVGTAAVSSVKTAGNAAIIFNEGYTSGLNNMNCVTIYNRVLTDGEVQQNFNAFRGRFGI